MSARGPEAEGALPGKASLRWRSAGAGKTLPFDDPRCIESAPGSEIVKDHARTRVTRAPWKGRVYYVKRYRRRSWRDAVVWAVLGSPARRSWEAAIVVESLGFACAPRVACIEAVRFGVPCEAWLVTAEVPSSIPAARWWRDRRASLSSAKRRDFLASAGAFLRRIHDAGLYTRDANGDNFVFREGAAPGLVWVDLDEVRVVRRVSQRRRLKNLAQVPGPIRDVPRTDRLRFLSAYLDTGRTARTLDGRLSDARERRAWARAASRVEARKALEYRRRARR